MMMIKKQMNHSDRTKALIKTTTKILLFTLITSVLYNLVTQRFLAEARPVKAIECCALSECTNRWPYNTIAAEVFSRRENFSCRVLGFLSRCYDSTITPTEKNVIYKYYLGGAKRFNMDYTEYLKEINPTEFAYYCYSGPEMINNRLSNPCPKNLRYEFSNGVKDCIGIG